LELFPGIEREPGETSVHLFGSVAVSAATTERIDMVAEWQETVDDPGLGEPTERDCSAHVFRLPVALADEFRGDSNPEDVPCKLNDSSLTFNTMAGASRTPPVPAKHEFGDTKHRTVQYRAIAGSAFREYFPAEFADTADLSVEGRPVTFNVLSSAPPAAPRVLYGIPTQAWQTSTDGPTITRRRRGGGIRVYLDRPWYSSGEGELLGVLVARETPLPHEAAYSMVSLIGRDPVYVSESLNSLTADSFPAHVASATGLSLPAALDHLGVTVLGHRPTYDSQTGRWFCDVDIDTQGAYFPFVRLALTRYQPDSLPGLHLSPIVLTDIVRLLPDRTLTVTTQTPLGVSVAGPAYQEPEGAHMIARLERRDPTVSDDVIGWRVIPGTITQLRPQFDEEGHLLASLGQVPVPPPQPGEIRRLAVMEFERLPSDTADGVTNERLIYCDTVEL
jgi:hypothetical protein